MTHSWLVTPPIVCRPAPKPRFRLPRRRSTRCPPNASHHSQADEKIGSDQAAGDGKVAVDQNDGATETGKFTTFGRFNASPKSVFRALTEYDGLQHMSHSIVSCKRMWISSRVGRTVLRLRGRDRSILWGTMKGDVIVEIMEDLQKGEISFSAENVDDRAAFAVKG